MDRRIVAFAEMMNVSDFLSTCLCLDLEARGDKLYRIGAVLGGASFERKGHFPLDRSVEALDAFGRDARHVLGHNVLGHDLPLLHRLFPHLRILQKPVVDTLFLSPLAFPQNPYHRLVKDYKLVRESLNDPVADARLAASVFGDQWESFAHALSRGEGRLLSLYRYCFEAASFAGGLSHGGLAQVFDALGVARIGRPEIGEHEAGELPLDQAAKKGAGYSVQPIRRGGDDDFRHNDFREVYTIISETLGDRVCEAALAGLLNRETFHEKDLPALAYSVAWLQVAGSNSVLPPWVRHGFPLVRDILRALRDVPCGEPSCQYCRAVHDPSAQLRRYFGFSGFRSSPVMPGSDLGLQEAVVRHGIGDKPLLAILPTGGGKSLCYQLPALVRHFRRGTLTIVISPLQALMKDQVDNLIARTGMMSTAALYGLLTPPERGEVLERVRLGDIAILYVAPEQLRNVSFRKTISQREIGSWVFDEAHCLSKWGHDFRPDYLYAGRFIREFSAAQKLPVPPIACFTATAKLDVKKEIIEYFMKELGQSLEVFEGSVERENLHFQVRMVTRAEKFGRIHDILTEHLPDSKGSAVVYTATRDGAEQAAEYLQLRGWPAAAFHAGLPAPEKRAVQESFIHGDTRVICATNAFGMGIDKEDVRLVLHVDIPGSLENYLQEAGRAGRDLKDAECVLLYDEQDVETQFRMEAASELTRRDIAEILRGLRRARRNETGDVVLTAGELLRAEEVETSFDFSDHGADTKVKTAVAWLERAGLVERNQNNTRVFQGMPLVKNMEEARARISRLNLSPTVQRRWESVLAALINADPDQGMSADELAELPAFRIEEGGGALRENRNREESDTQVVLRALNDMAEAGLVKKGLLLSAFVRHKVKMHSQLILERVSSLEEKMLGILRELAPDAAEEGWLDLSLRKLNQRLVDDGHAESSPQVILSLLKSLSMDGRGLAGNRGSLDLHQIHQDLYRIKLQRGWDALAATARKRRKVAQVALETMLSKIPPDAPPGADLLVSFSSDDIAQAMRRNVYLAGRIKDPLAAIDRGLMFLHEQKAIILQQGLAVFRQAMTIRVLPQARSRKYTAGDYEPLQWHYRERVLQVHVMNEYARLGLEKIRQALEMVLAYFSMDKAAFVKRFFAGRKEIIERATGQESYRRIVDELGNRAQAEIVGAPDTGNMLVLAGPGSGKTKVVVHRCAYLLRVKRAPARSLLVLCYNRSAAVSLRHRLFDLVGEDSKGIMVQTYHGLAMRLTGASFADLAERGGGEAPDFGRLIPDAVSLLRGGKEVPGLEPDELRDRLLAGYRHILVDEYQDIDREQYDLISALAGRTEQDHDRKLTILAVGDDDQNIYTFRGANVEFIRKFRDDYRAQVFHLVENYRSTGHIISAANRFIGHNRDRMKTGHPIRVDKRREVHPPGGRWEALDPIGRGRVQVVEVEDDYLQAVALVEEMLRLRALDPGLRWSDCGVLARTRETLSPIRALCEHHGIPVVWGLSGNKTPALHRIREIGRFLDELKSRRGDLLRGSQLKDLMTELAGGDGCTENPWWLRLLDLIESWMDETADEPMPAGHTVEYIHEALSEQRRDQSVGRGVFLGTVHGAKGMEYGHVFIPDGGWGKGRKPREEEEEEDRRVFYVGMTRARETLCLFQRRDVTNPHVRLLDGNFLVRRQAPPPRAAVSSPEDEASPAVPREVSSEVASEVTRPITFGVLREITRYRYELLGLQDMFLDLAARRPPDDPIHRRLGALKPGSVLEGRKAGDRMELLDEEGACVAALSRAASAVWLPRLPLISSIRVVGVIRRNRKDSGQEYSHLHRCDSWEVPWVEVVYHPPSSRQVTIR